MYRCIKMKIVRYSETGKDKPKVGLLTEKNVIDLNKAYVAYLKSEGEEKKGDLVKSVVDFFEKGDAAKDTASKVLKYVKGKESSLSGVVHKTKDVKLVSPIGSPPKIIALAGNYISHVREVRKDRPLPGGIMLFAKSIGKYGVVGPGSEILVPNTITKLDYELELGVVIGKQGKYIPVEKAYDHVGGYTVFNDVCDRWFLMDVPMYDWFGMKAQDSFSVFGPCIETDIDDPNDLRMTLKVDGELRQDGATSDMINPVPHVVSYVSSLVTLEVGDVIATGTCEGNSMTWGRRENIPSGGKWLQDGQAIEAWIENIGTLKNKVKFEDPVYRT
jgi:2-keto-4-pentenoate hydratase/2-oxohepta-3-ene-1,7-dioic acid hydratase in catechol pathway